MAFTGRLGTENSQLGLIELGALGSAEQAASFTADAFIQPFFRADAVIKREQTASFTSDAVISTAAEVSTSFTADSFIHLYFRADAYIFTPTLASFSANAVIKRNQTASFTVDATVLVPGQFSANAIISRERRMTPFTANARKRVVNGRSLTSDATISPRFTANTVLLKTQDRTFDGFAWITGAGVVGFTADAAIKRNQTRSLTADAMKRQGRTASFTADAQKRRVVPKSLLVDAYIQPPARQEHARTGPHIGVDDDLDHTIAWSFDRYWRGESLHEVLADIDARLSARETGSIAYRRLLPTEAIINALQTKSLLLDAYYVIRQLTSFTANAFVNPYFTSRAVIKAFMSSSFVADAAIFPRRFPTDAWINNPNIVLWDDIQAASPWPIGTHPIAARINTASLTGDAVNDPPWWDTPGDYRTAWTYFILTEAKTVILDTIGTDGDTVIQLWQGTPGSWPSDPIAFSDDDVDNLPGMGYSNAEYIEVLLDAGTYWVLVHPYDVDDPGFNMLLQMQTTT